ncbi:MAG: diguanylate cyclase [Pseudomonadota bacterium]
MDKNSSAAQRDKYQDRNGALDRLVLLAAQNQASFELILENITQGVSLNDANGQIVYQNQVFRDLLGDIIETPPRNEQETLGFLKDHLAEKSDLEPAGTDGHAHLLLELPNKRAVEVRLIEIQGNMFLIVAEDKTNEVRLKQDLILKAFTDPLTGLDNRRGLKRKFSESRDLKASPFLWLAIFDLDHFKKANDTYGHEAGDEILIKIAEILNTRFQNAISIARIGGDEFAIVGKSATIEAPNIYSNAKAVITNMKQHAGTSEIWNEIGMSIGIIVSPHKDDLGSIMRQADENLYKAKSLGRGTVVMGRDLQ